MDQLSAHLDRGWDLVQRGDLKAARVAAKRAVQAAPESPEAHNLLGYVAAQDGDSDEALEHYRQAIALDDGYIDPFLNAAEVLIHPLQQFDEAIAMCDEVLEFAEAPEETADAALLKVDALLGKGERESARAVLKLVPDAAIQGAVYPFLVGRAMYEVGQSSEAESHLAKAAEADPQNPDAHYYLGLVRDEKNDRRAAALAFLEARELDMAAPTPPWSPSKAVFQQSVEKAVARLPPELLKAIDGTLILVADAPGMEVVADGVDPRAPVLLDGTPPPETPGPLATRVFIYRRNIERLCGGIEQIEDEVASQLEDEIRHVLAHGDGADGVPEGTPAVPAAPATPAVPETPTAS